MKGGLDTDRNQKIFLIVLTALLIASVSVLAAFRIHGNKTPDKTFTPPAFEQAAQTGTPSEVGASYESIELPVPNGKCIVAMDVKPAVDGNTLQVFVTSSVENNAWIRIVLYDQDQIVGECGLLRPGEYVEAVTLTKTVESGSLLKAKLLTYEPDTYYSVGTASANILVR